MPLKTTKTTKNIALQKKIEQVTFRIRKEYSDTKITPLTYQETKHTMPRCTYAGLQGRDRTEAFKKFLKKKGFGVKRKRDKNGKRIIGPNHVSQIMKRRAEKARADERASEQVWRDYAARREAEERAEKFNRIFFGTTPKMEYEKQRAEEVRKYKEEVARKQREMPYKIWLTQYFGDEFICRHYVTKANKIRLAWKLRMRRLAKKRSRRVHFAMLPEVVEFMNGENDYFNIVKILK